VGPRALLLPSNSGFICTLEMAGNTDVMRVKWKNPKLYGDIQGGSNMTGTVYTCLHTNQSQSYLNHLVY